jgi:hypothetical protein
MVEMVVQYTIDVPGPWCHIKQSLAMKAVHLTGVLALNIGLHPGLLGLIVHTGIRLAALINPLSSAVLLRDICFEPSSIMVNISTLLHP